MIHQGIDGNVDSLDAPRLRGKQRARKMLILLEEERQRVLERIEQEAKEQITLLTSIRKQTGFAITQKDTNHWGMYGPSQGNVGRHLDALAGYALGLETAIKLLYEVLEQESPYDKKLPSFRKEQREQEQGQEQARAQGGQEQGAEEGQADFE